MMKEVSDYFKEDVTSIASAYNNFIKTNDETDLYDIGPMDYVSEADSLDEVSYFCWSVGKTPHREIRFYFNEDNSLAMIDYEVYNGSQSEPIVLHDGDVYNLLEAVFMNVFFDAEVEIQEEER